MTDRQRWVLAILRAAPAPLDLRGIRAALRIEAPKWQIKDDIAALHKQGLIRNEGERREARWAVVPAPTD